MLEGRFGNPSIKPLPAGAGVKAAVETSYGGDPRRRRPGPETGTLPGEAGAGGAVGEKVAVL